MLCLWKVWAEFSPAAASLGSQASLGKGRPSVLFFRIPVHTIFDSCPEGNGIRSIAITHDAKLLATISDAEIQVKWPLGTLSWPTLPDVFAATSAQATWGVCVCRILRLHSAAWRRAEGGQGSMPRTQLFLCSVRSLR